MIHITLEQEVLFWIGNFAITNSLLTSWVAMFVLVIIAGLLGRSFTDYVSTNPRQHILQTMLKPLWSMVARTLGDASLTRTVFPFIATFFLFIISANWLEILPGFLGSFYAETPQGRLSLLRSPTTDLNTTIALALVSVGLTQFLAIRHLGVKKFFIALVDVRRPLEVFVRALEVASELTKVFSFAFRLFGNMFAGGVLLVVTGFLIPYLIPIPFMVLEIFVGFVQALIFSLLTLMFIKASLAHR